MLDHNILSTIKSTPLSSKIPTSSLKENELVSKSSAYSHILKSFNAPIEHAFAYGSSVFPQSFYSNKAQSMVDLIFAVKDPLEWHKINLKQNRSHYSFLKYFGPKNIANINELGAHLCYNPYVKIENTCIKYGIVSIQNLISDLVNWDSLYLAGRMHKPLIVVKHNDSVSEVQKLNLANALNVALLLLPSEFNERQLFTKITGISYTGDVRMGIGENPNKIINIVTSQHQDFRDIYDSVIGVCPHIIYRKSVFIRQDSSIATKKEILNSLPSHLKEAILCEMKKRFFVLDSGRNSLESLASRHDLTSIIETAISNIVREKSLAQSVKGFFTAGLGKSLKYFGAKVCKRISLK